MPPPRDAIHRLLLKVVARSVGYLLPPTLLARRYPGVPGRVHANDLMLRSASPEDLAHHVSDAESAMENLEASLAVAGRGWGDVSAFLDLPSGYGRVTRFLAARLGAGKVTACDVDTQAVRFCIREFGVKGVVANHEPTRTAFPERYDAAFVGSLLTHVAAPYAIDVLSSVVDAMTTDGLLIFSTQGESCLGHLAWYGPSFARDEEWYRAQVRHCGIAFKPYPRRRDYGVTIHARSYVERLVRDSFGPRLRLLRFAERGWDRHQDIWTYQLCAGTADGLAAVQ